MNCTSPTRAVVDPRGAVIHRSAIPTAVIRERRHPFGCYCAWQPLLGRGCHRCDL